MWVWAGVEDQRDLATLGFYSVDGCGDVSIPAVAFDDDHMVSPRLQFMVQITASCYCYS